jgi:antitoxin component of MazEF toxin-antitoxin module
MKARTNNLCEESPVQVIAIEEQPLSLEELVARITPENRHREAETGASVGNEVW